MIRLLLVMVLTMSSPASAAADGDWRPAAPDRLALLDAAMAPLLVAFDPAYQAVIQDLTIITAFVQFEGMDAAAVDMQRRLDAANQLPRDLDALQALAAEGLAVLDSAVSEPCMWDYVAVVRAGWLLLGDSVDSFRAVDAASANMQVGSARYLLLPYGDLVRNQADKDCGRT